MSDIDSRWMEYEEGQQYPYHQHEKDRHREADATMGYLNGKDHLEDFDSQKGDIESGSRGATQNSSTNRLQQYSSNESAYDDSVRRGIRNAQAEQHRVSSRTPGRFMDEVLQGAGGGYSVTTGRMDDMMDTNVYDTYTFDGSTITSANDITHKRFQPQQAVLDFEIQPHYQQDHQYTNPDLKPGGPQATVATGSSSKESGKSSESKIKRICCGLGRAGVILISLALVAVSVAFILWLVMSYLPSQQESAASTSSPCCKGVFEPGWSGREICNAQSGGRPDICCVVCADTIIESNPSPSDGSGDPSIVPETDAPIPGTPQVPITESPEAPKVETPAPVPVTMPPEKFVPEPTIAPSVSPTTEAGQSFPNPTNPPTTLQPQSTPFPTTTAPVTGAPITGAPVTGAPVTAAPVTAPPTTARPTLQPTMGATVMTPYPSAAPTTAKPTDAVVVTPAPSARQTPADTGLSLWTPPPFPEKTHSPTSNLVSTLPFRPCCPGEPERSDVIGQVKCALNNPNDCCEVCILP